MNIRADSVQNFGFNSAIKMYFVWKKIRGFYVSINVTKLT